MCFSTLPEPASGEGIGRSLVISEAVWMMVASASFSIRLTSSSQVGMS